jgi:hypothetical protein
MKQILVRLDDELGEELRQAAYNERLSMTEIIEQGLIIRLHLPRKDKLNVLLERLGYQERRLRAQARAEARAEANGHLEPVPADPWDLGSGGDP